MRIKLDENLGVRGAQLLEGSGCDVATVVAEDLCSSSDEASLDRIDAACARRELGRKIGGITSTFLANTYELA